MRVGFGNLPEDFITSPGPSKGGDNGVLSKLVFDNDSEGVIVSTYNISN